jgi:hypothetical protein
MDQVEAEKGETWDQDREGDRQMDDGGVQGIRQHGSGRSACLDGFALADR